MTGNENQQEERGLVLARPELVVPIEEVGLSKLEKYVGLTHEFQNQVVRFNEVMTPRQTEEMHGIGQVDYFIQPGKNPVVERRVRSGNPLCLRISVTPGSSPGRGVVQLLIDSVGMPEVAYRDIVGSTELLAFHYFDAGHYFEFEELQAFVRKAFPGRKCTLRGLDVFLKGLKEYSRNFLRVQRETWEKSFWKRNYGHTKTAKRLLKHVLPYEMWELCLEGRSVPLLIFSSNVARIPVHHESNEEFAESRVLCRVPRIFFAGNAAEAEHVLRCLTDLFANCWSVDTARRFTSRPTTIWQRWHNDDEDFPG